MTPTFQRLAWSCCCFGSLLAAQSLQITSPVDGTVVRPGQTLVVQVTASGGPFQQVVIIPSQPMKWSSILIAPPYEFTIQIPSNITPGEYLLTASGATGPGQGAESEPTVIVVEPEADPMALIVQPSTLYLWVGDTGALSVKGRFYQGPDLNMTFSKKITYSFATPAIATVDNLGRVTAVAPGRGTILVGTTGPIVEVPVTVAPPMAVIPRNPVLRASQSVQFGAQVKVRAGRSATWALNPNVGTIVSTGPDTATYTAPASIGAQQIITVTATSTEDPSKSATATVTLYPPIVVSVSPATATLRASQTQQFTASVAYASNRQVTWSVIPSGAGTVSATGLYTAPSPMEANQKITVKATSVEDPAKSASATVSLRKSR